MKQTLFLTVRSVLRLQRRQIMWVVSSVMDIPKRLPLKTVFSMVESKVVPELVLFGDIIMVEQVISLTVWKMVLTHTVPLIRSIEAKVVSSTAPTTIT